MLHPSISHSSNSTECREMNPMFKAWREYQQSRPSTYHVTRSASLPCPGEAYQPRILKNIEDPSRPEREESPALQRNCALSKSRLFPKKESKQCSIDIEKSRSVESGIEYLKNKHQRLLEKLNGIETSHKQNIKDFNDSDDKLRDKVVSSNEDVAFNVDNQVLQEEKEILLKKSKDLEGELCFFKQEDRINGQKLENSGSKVESLKTGNLHLEKEVNSIISKVEAEELNGCGRERTDSNPVDDGGEKLINRSLGQQKENARETDNKEQASSSYSQEQLKELMEKVDAATNKENEGPAGDTVSFTARDDVGFGKFLSSITQCSLDENDLGFTLEAKSTEEFEVLRPEKSEDNNREEYITTNISKGSSCLISSSNAENSCSSCDTTVCKEAISAIAKETHEFRALRSDKSEDNNREEYITTNSSNGRSCLISSSNAENPCSTCDTKVCEEAISTIAKETHDQRGLNLLQEREKIVRRLLLLLNCLNPVNGQDEENQRIVTETACPQLIFDKIEVQGKSVLCDSVHKFKASFHLEEPLHQQVNEQGGMKTENKNSQSFPPSGTVAQSNWEIENNETHHINEIYKELEKLECYLIQNKLATKELELFKNLRERIKELQEYLESQPTTKENPTSMEFDDCKMNFKTSFDQANRSSKTPSMEKLNVHNETVEELETSLNQTKAEILTLENTNDKLNVEKTAAIAAMDETKKGLAKASEHVAKLEKDLEIANEERKRLGVALKMVYNGLKMEQEEKKTLQAKIKVSQEENAHVKVELQTVTAVLEKEKEVRRIAIERERVVQEVLDEARESRERMTKELSMLMDHKQTWQAGQISSQKRILNQEEDHKLKRLAEIVEKINSTMTERAALHCEELKEAFFLKEEIIFRREENNSLKAKVTDLSRRLKTNREEKRMLSFEIERLSSVTNESSANVGKTESSEQVVSESEIKQKNKGSKKSLRRKLSVRLSSGSVSKTDSSLSKEFDTVQDKRMSRLEVEVALLREELHRGFKFQRNLFSENNLHSSSTDSEDSETSEPLLTQEDKGTTVQAQPLEVKNVQKLEHELKIDSELEELKHNLTTMIKDIESKMDENDTQIHKISEELNEKNHTLMSVQTELNGLKAKNCQLKKEIATLQDELESERHKNLEYTERQKYLDQALNEALKSKLEMGYHYSCSENSTLVDSKNSDNFLNKGELEKLCCELQNIYDPSAKLEKEAVCLKEELRRKSEKLEKLEKKSLKNPSLMKLTDELTLLNKEIKEMQSEKNWLKEEIDLLKQQNEAYKKAFDSCSLKQNISKQKAIKLLNLDSVNNNKRESNKESKKITSNIESSCESKNLTYKNEPNSSEKNNVVKTKVNDEDEKQKLEQENESGAQPQLRTKLLRLKSDLNVAEQEKTNLEKTLSFFHCANKSYEAELCSIKLELEREVVSKCSYKYREARLQESLSLYKEEIVRLNKEVLKLYKYATLLDTDESLKKSLNELKTHSMTILHEDNDKIIRKSTIQEDQRQKLEKRLCILKDLSQKEKERQIKAFGKHSEDLAKANEKLLVTMQKLAADQKQNKDHFQNLLKALEEKKKVEEEIFGEEKKRKELVKELEETIKTLREFINSEDERKALNQELTICENICKETDERNKEEVEKLKEKVNFLEKSLVLNETETKKLREENIKLEEDARKLSEQVSEEVENARNEGRQVEADLQHRIEDLQTELKSSREQLAKENENFQKIYEDFERVTVDYEKCKSAYRELSVLEKEHKNYKMTLTENEQLRKSCASLSDKVVILSKELETAKEENGKCEKTNLALRDASTALYIEVVTLKAVLEIMKSEKIKTQRSELFHSPNYNVTSGDRSSESGVNDEPYY